MEGGLSDIFLQQRLKVTRNEMMIKTILMCLVATALGQPINPASVSCGVAVVQPITTRIAGGMVAKPGSWPWTVLLVDEIGFISGSGALIHNHVILTSAQHVERPGFALDLHYWKIYAGSYNISTNDPHEKYFRINKVVLHPGYNISSLENNIALIITKEPVQYNNHTRPACLPDSNHTYTVGKMCYLPGWENTSSTGTEQLMKQVGLPMIADTTCQSHWQDFLPENELCAGYENGGNDYCGDDIGSPLMCNDQNGVWYIQGLASSGGDCKKVDKPGIFEDVSVYSDWIKKTMQTAGYPYNY